MIATLANLKVPLPMPQIAAFCRRWSIARLEVFGSVLRDDFRPDSDVDALEFETGRAPGFLGLACVEEELSHLLGRKVELNTPMFLSPYFRERVLSEAEVQYVQA